MARGSSFLRDLTTTALTSVATVVCLVFTVKLLAAGLGARQFGAYALARRIVTLLDPLVTLSTGIGLARYVATSSAHEERQRYAAGAFLLVNAANAVLMLAVLAWREPLAVAVFGREGAYGALLVCIALLMWGYSCFAVLYAFYRGAGDMALANGWQLACIAVGPLAIAFAWADRLGVEEIVLGMAALLACSLAPLVPVLRGGLRAPARALRESMAKLAQYGVPRIFSTVGFGAILSIGPLVAAHFASLREAGFLVIGQFVLRFIEGGVEAVNRVGMPRFAQAFAEGGRGAIRAHVVDLTATTLHLGVFGTIQLVIFSQPLIRTWLGTEYLEADTAMRITLAALTPYLAYVLLRAVLDAVHVQAVANRPMLWSLATTLVASVALAYAGYGVEGIAAGTAAGLFVLGFGVAWRIFAEYAIRLRELDAGACLGANVVLGALGGWAATLLPAGGGLGEGAALVALAAALCSAYVAILRALKVGWVVRLHARMR